MDNSTDSIKRILVALDLTHQSGREHLTGFYRYADRKLDWNIILVPSTEESYAPMVKTIIEKGIDGAVVKGECTPSVAEEICSSHVPIVAIDRPRHPTPRKADTYVICDNRRIGREAAQYFDSVKPFASYAFLPDSSDCEWSRARGKAFRTAVKKRHKNAKVVELVLPIAEMLVDLPKPVAVFAAFDQCAATVVNVCRELNLKIPLDVAVLGVDDDAFVCDHTRPKLTSIRPDHTGQGYMAAKVLDEILCGGAGRRGLVVRDRIAITERESTIIVSADSRLVREANAYLDEHALEQIRVSDVVSHLSVSTRLANLHYSKCTGRSIQEELVTRRLAEARRLLKDTDFSMAKIASRCGFRSQIVLSHLFTKRFGMSMSAWREKSRAEEAALPAKRKARRRSHG